MAKIPSPESVSAPGSMRPSSPAPVADMTGLARGVQNLAGSAQRIIGKERERQNMLDFAAAEAAVTRSYLDIGNRFENEGGEDYLAYGEQAEEQTQAAIAEAGAMIRDDRARAQWIAANETSRIRQVDTLGDLGRSRARQADRAKLDNALGQYAEMISDPGTNEELRDRARQNLDATISVARDEGLIDETEEFTLRERYVDAAEEQYSKNYMELMILTDPAEAARITGEAIGVGVDGQSLRKPARIPIVTGNGVNTADVNPITLNKFEQLQGFAGKQMPIISGTRDPDHNDDVGGASESQHLPGQGSTAIDIDVSALSKEERLQVIEAASAMGFTGIGVYSNSLHLDTRQGDRFGWGPSHKYASTPDWAKETIDRHLAGQITQMPVKGDTGTVDPRVANLSTNDRISAYDAAKARLDKADMSMRADIQVAAQNAPAAIAANGAYTGFQPTANDFVAAWGADEGLLRAKEYDTTVKIAQDVFSMRSMTNEEIAVMVEEARESIGTGDEAALQTERYAQLAQAAQTAIDDRLEDPAAYVTQSFPAVGDAWEAARENPSDTAAYQNALTVTALAQQDIGLTTMELLPKALAEGVATTFNSPGLPDAQRVAAIEQTVFGTQDREQQKAIVDQLVKAGLPEEVTFALDAKVDRGDDGAAFRLMQAAMASPETLKTPLPGDIKDAQVIEGIGASVFDTGQIGDVIFDLTGGSLSNQEQAMHANSLMANSVKLRLLDGSAGGNLQTAIDLTIRDMFGDQRVVTGNSWGGNAGLKITLKPDEDEATMRTGFDSLLAEVGEALEADLMKDGFLGTAETATGQRAIMQAGVSNYIAQALSSGYFANAGDDTFKFIDPNWGAPVLGMDGTPLLFTREQVLAAGMEVGSTPGAAPPPEEWGTGEGDSEFLSRRDR